MAFIEIAELDTKGGVFFPDLIKEIIQRYKFQKFPQAPDEVDGKKGFEFQIGIIGGKVVDALKIYDTIIVVETHSHTDDSKQIIEELLDWGKQKFGMSYTPEMIRHWAYVNNIMFYSDIPLLGKPDSPIAKLSSKTGNAVSKIWDETINYHPTAFAVGHDPATRKNAIAHFTLTRRAEAPFSENKYFSESPLPTDLHIKFLEELEADVIAQHQENRTASQHFDLAEPGLEPGISKA